MATMQLFQLKLSCHHVVNTVWDADRPPAPGDGQWCARCNHGQGGNRTIKEVR